MTSELAKEPHTPRGARRNKQRKGANARARKVAITGHGGRSSVLLQADFHMGSRIGRAYRARRDTLTAHLAAEPTAPQRILIDHAARLHLLGQMAWAEVLRAGAFNRGALRPAVDAYRRAAADEREVLRLLGLERKEKPVPTLLDYIAGKAE